MDEESKMANYNFSILANHWKHSKILFDHGIELGGGQPFTVGLKVTFVTTQIHGKSVLAICYIDQSASLSF